MTTVDPKIILYTDWTVQELRTEAKRRGLKGYSSKKKGELVAMIKENIASPGKTNIPGDVEEMTIPQLKEAIKALNGTGYSRLKKSELQDMLMKLSSQKQ